MGRIRLKHIKSREGSEIQDFITETIVPGSTMISDRHSRYPVILKKGYLHDPQKKSTSGKRWTEMMNGYCRECIEWLCC